ncbi:MAG TPA: hypothetical protein VGF71_00265 [Caulobacteraceae bacterium]|jgi:hypothetical protein
MSKITLIIALGVVLAAPIAWAQQSPVATPPPGEPAANPIPDLSNDRTTVMVTPDPSATSMADPQSAAEYGSPSAVDSPSSPMPDPNGWPTPRPSAKRPKWVKKAPASVEPPPAPNPH